MKFSRNFSPGQMDIDAMCPLKSGILQLAIAAPYATGKLILMHCVRSRSLLELSRHTPNSTEWQIKVFCREGGQRNIHVSSGQRNSQRNIHVSCGQRNIHVSSQPSRQKTLIFRCVPVLAKESGLEVLLACFMFRSGDAADSSPRPDQPPDVSMQSWRPFCFSKHRPVTPGLSWQVHELPIRRIKVYVKI